MTAPNTYRGSFYTRRQAGGDILREIFAGLRTGRQDSMAAREQRRLELEREQLRLDRLEERDYGRKRDAASDARQAIVDNIAQIRERLALEKEGVFAGAAPTTASVDLTAFGGVGSTAIPDRTPYQDMGNGYHRNPRKTPEALSAAHQARIERITSMIGGGNTAARSMGIAAGMTPQQIDALDPARRPGSAEALAAQRAELELQDTYKARGDARQVAGQLRVAGANRAADAAAAGAEAPKLTDGERKNAAYLEIARAAMPTLDAAKTPGRIERGLAAAGLNEAVSDDMQRTWQAGLQFADAYLRFTSGANSPEPEVIRTAQTFTAMPGDSEAVKRQKDAARKTAMRAMEIGAGNAVSRVSPLAPMATHPNPFR